MRTPSDERGFTLVLVIICILLLSVGVAVGFARNSGELHSYSDQEAQVKAAAIAQTGFYRYLSALTAVPTSGSADVTLTGIMGGSAVVSLRRVRDSAGVNADLYVLTSRGIATTANRLGHATPIAEHTFSHLLAAPDYKYGMNILGAYTSLNGVTHSGPKAVMDGNDADKASGVAKYPDPVAGIAAPTGTFTPGSPGVDLKGTPVGSALGLGTLSQAQDALNLDWNNILNGGSIVPTLTVSNCSALPSSSSYPIVRVNGDCNITGGAFNGTLIVTGNLTLSGSPQLRGIMLVGQNFNTTGSPQAWGAIISGLNTMIPSMPQPSGVDLMSGNAQYWYNSKEINKAFTSFGLSTANPVLIVVGNAYEDNVPTY